MKKVIFLFLLLVSAGSNSASWTKEGGSNVDIVNPGVIENIRSTFITLSNADFSGCPRTDGAVLIDSNPSYDEIYSLFLVAKITGKLIRIHYHDCHNRLPIVTQAYLLK